VAELDQMSVEMLESVSRYVSRLRRHARALSIVFEGQTTGINTVKTAAANEDDEWYDLSGRRVAQPAKGIYVKNGRNEVRPTSDEPRRVGLERIPHSVAFSDGEKFFLAASKGASQRQFSKYRQAKMTKRRIFAPISSLLTPVCIKFEKKVVPLHRKAAKLLTLGN